MPIDDLPGPVRTVTLAVDAVISGDRDAAQSLLQSIDERALDAERHERNSETRGLPGSGSGRKREISQDAAIRMHQRNGWRCRYDRCGFTPVIDQDVLKLLGTAGLFAYYIPVPRRWHRIAWTYQAAPEHVDPGTADPRRWTTACWTCNYAKSNISLDVLGWRWDPEPPTVGWGGLRDRLDTLRATLRGT